MMVVLSMVQDLKSRHPNEESARKLFLESKDIGKHTESNLSRACSFYIVNKCGFSGLRVLILQ